MVRCFPNCSVPPDPAPAAATPSESNAFSLAAPSLNSDCAKRVIFGVTANSEDRVEALCGGADQTFEAITKTVKD